MTTRRTMLRMAGAVPVAALLAACDQAVGPTDGPPIVSGSGPVPQDVLVIRTSAGLALISTTTSKILYNASAAAVACDGSALAAANGSQVHVVGPAGQNKYTFATKGSVGPRVISPDGTYIALASGGGVGGETAYHPQGRSETTIVVATSAGERIRVTLPGCLEPEAFSADGTVLYVLDFLPPTAPDRYRVRKLDIATGKFTALYTRDKKVIPPGAEEEMHAQGRQAVYASSVQTLFTLYTHQPGHEHTRDLLSGVRDDAPDVHAFVHSLSLNNQFAYCIDLPAPFGEAPAASHAITLAPGTEIPYVVDASTGTIAVLDKSELSIRATRRSVFPTSTKPAAAAVSRSGDTLFVGAGAAIHALSTETFAVRAQWGVPGEVRGMVSSPDGKRLWIGLADRIVSLDSATGVLNATVAAPGLEAVLHATPA